MTERNRLAAGLPRRTVVTVGGVGISAGLLAACGSDDGNGSGSPSTTPSSEASTSEAPTSQTPSESPSSAAPSGLVATADVPVGGGVILGDERLVVTQPIAGEFHGFSSTCTHRGCQVSEVTDTINCACHGSRFAIEDGSVVSGPATAALPGEQVSVKGGQVVRG
ncbi:Rieske (2Fe-2S) protein [Nocardioides dubius]|uniref:Rieske domain-containing protein n=1 Tax=Nocardioides dubius TaxID=317019 RepID=A0ABN1TLW7_9ACTN